MKLPTWCAVAVIFLVAGCSTVSPSAGNHPEQLVPDTRTANIPDLDNREATIVPRPQSAK